MKLPFVLRSTMDRYVRAAEVETVSWEKLARERGDDLETVRDQKMELHARAIAAEGALEVERARYDALFEKYDGLKVQGAVAPIAPLERKESDALDQAVSRAVVGLPPNLRRAAYAQLATDRKAIAAGFADEDEVLHRIEHGIPTEGVP